MLSDGSNVSLYVIVFPREIKALQEIEDNPYVSITDTVLSCYLYVCVNCFTSQSTIFQLCQDNFQSSFVEPVLSSG